MKPTTVLFSIAAVIGSVAANAQTPPKETYRWTGKDGKVNYSDQPPSKNEAKKVEKLKMGTANVVDVGNTPFDLQQASQDFPITLYVSPDCESECKMAREYLGRRGLPFTEKSISSIEDSEAFKKSTGIAELAVPSLQVGSKAQKGFEENAWKRLIDAAGYPASVAKAPTAVPGR